MEIFIPKLVVAQYYLRVINLFLTPACEEQRVKYTVELRNVKKRFGKVTALKGVTLKVLEGEVFGLIGPNGAGKTTTLRIIATLVRHDEGYVNVLGYELPKNRKEVRKLISYLPEDASLYHRLTGWENLLYFAMIYAESKENAHRLAEEGARIAGLSSNVLRRRAGEYSKGMARRIAVARTLMARSKLVILDEPTSGLDVFSAVRIREMIRDFAKNMKTIIISSHNMLEVQYLCDRVALIHEGRIIATDSPSNLVKYTNATNLEEAFIKLVGDYSE